MANALHLLEMDHLGGPLFDLPFQIGVQARQRLGRAAFQGLAPTQTLLSFLSAVISRPMKKCCCSGSDQIPVQLNVTTKPRLWA
jgi:hypothetical protein